MDRLGFSLTLFALGCVVFLFRGRLLGWLTVERAMLLLLPVAVLALAANVAGGLPEGLGFLFNDPRLAPSLAWAMGYNPYSAPADGPILNNIYGPVGVLVYYLPCKLFHDPLGAIEAGWAVNVLLFLLPVSLFLGRSWRRWPGSFLACAWALLFFCFAVVDTPPTRYALFHIHSDASALASGALACYFVTGTEKISRPRVLASACFAVLAVWSKQVEAPLLAAVGLYVHLAFGGRWAIGWLAALAAIGAAVSAVFIGMFGWDNLWFNLFSIPARHSVQMQWVHQYRCVLFSLPAVLVIVLAVYLRRATEAGTEGRAAWLRANPWALPVLAGLALVPTSLLGAAKIGGDSNSFHHVYYLLLAAALIQAQVLVQARAAPVRKLAALGLLSSAAVYGVLGAETAVVTRPRLDVLSQQAFVYLKAHPETAYFPWHPLAGLYAEHRLYHFQYGMIDRNYAGYGMSPQHFRAYLPRKLVYVVFPPGMAREECPQPRYLSEYSRLVDLPELPGWNVYAKPEK